MEAVQEILMNASEEELAVLIGYCDAILVGSNYKAKLAAMETKEERVSRLILTIQEFAKSYFLTNLSYDEIVVKVAKRMDISINDNDPTDWIEAKIACRFITDNFTNIPEEQRRELVEILKCGPIKNSKLRLIADDLILANTKSASAMYPILSWLAKSALQSFLTNNGDAFESTGRVKRILRNLFGGSIFRKAMILPLIHISMLRYQYRCLPKSRKKLI